MPPSKHGRPAPACSYFNWRQDTSSDLQLFAVLSFVLVLFGGLVKGTLIAQVRSRGDLGLCPTPWLLLRVEIRALDLD